MKKIFNLIDMTQREIKRGIPTSENLEEVSCQTLLDLKRFFEINSLCAIEIHHTLHSLGFVSIGLTVIKLFQSFKNQMADFVRYNMLFFKPKGLYMENDDLLDDPKQDAMNKTLKKRQSKLFS